MSLRDHVRPLAAGAAIALTLGLAACGDDDGGEVRGVEGDCAEASASASASAPASASASAAEETTTTTASASASGSASADEACASP